jgi:hypothetical protein
VRQTLATRSQEVLGIAGPKSGTWGTRHPSVAKANAKANRLILLGGALFVDRGKDGPEVICARSVLGINKKQAWTGRSTIQPAGRPTLHFYAQQVGNADLGVDGSEMTYFADELLDGLSH